MNISEALSAVTDARSTIDAADQVIRDTAEMMRWRLELAKVNRWALADMKRELRDFNLTTLEWRKR